MSSASCYGGAAPGVHLPFPAWGPLLELCVSCAFSLGPVHHGQHGPDRQAGSFPAMGHWPDAFHPLALERGRSAGPFGGGVPRWGPGLGPAFCDARGLACL